MRIFYDIEQEQYITEKALFGLFLEFKADPENHCDYDFSHYVSNCLTANNGSLETVKNRAKSLERLLASLIDDPDEQRPIMVELEVLRTIEKQEAIK